MESGNLPNDHDYIRKIVQEKLETVNRVDRFLFIFGIAWFHKDKW